jgi:hypothetical protein
MLLHEYTNGVIIKYDIHVDKRETRSHTAGKYVDLSRIPRKYLCEWLLIYFYYKFVIVQYASISFSPGSEFRVFLYLKLFFSRAAQINSCIVVKIVSLFARACVVQWLFVYCLCLLRSLLYTRN